MAQSSASMSADAVETREARREQVKLIRKAAQSCGQKEEIERERGVGRTPRLCEREHIGKLLRRDESLPNLIEDVA